MNQEDFLTEELSQTTELIEYSSDYDDYPECDFIEYTTDW